jgi:hypothetical protein
MIRLRNRTAESAGTSMWRSRWAAIGAAVAVSVGAGGFFIADAASGPESTMTMIDPVRVLDTRDPVNVGLPGPFVSPVSQKLQVAGPVPTTMGTQTPVPTGATGVLLNVTSVGATADGFISIRPGDAAGSPATSSLNVTAGVTVPNSVQVALPITGANAGKIDITWDALGVAGPTRDILIDVVAYTLKADFYTKAEVDAGFVPQGEIVLSHGALVHPNAASTAPTVENYLQMTRVEGNGSVQAALEGPSRLGGVDYGLKSVTYCFRARVAPYFVTSAQVNASEPALKETKDVTDRSTNGCYTLAVNDGTSTSFIFSLTLAGGGGQVEITSITSTWSPTSALSPAPLGGDVDLSDPAYGG